jgi:Ser-tRNA(Ala) deacylase AlaX
MTDRLYQRDSYLKAFDGRVTAVRSEGVVLDRTAFFPTGGGVLGDEGELTGAGGPAYRVVETLDDEHVLHRQTSRASTSRPTAVATWPA